MPHKCTDCGRAFEDGSKEMLSGCPDCGGTTFQFRPDGPEPSGESDDAPEPPGPDVDGVARTVGSAASTVRNLVAGGRRSDDEAPGVEPADDSRTGDASPERDGSGATDNSADTGAVADTTADPDRSRRTGRAAPGEVESPEDTTDSETASEGNTGDGLEPSGASADVDSTDEGTAGIDPMEAEWPGTDDGQHRSTSNADGIVEADEPPSGSGNSRDRPPVPDPRPLSARSGDGGEPDVDEGIADNGNVDVTGEGSEERPSLSELRAELNDQFESIRVVAPGQYELNLMELYDRQEYIIALQEDGKYTVQVPDRWE
jgi:predicted  nucleic acid-binding Zn-ribbon protein